MISISGLIIIADVEYGVDAGMVRGICLKCSVRTRGLSREDIRAFYKSHACNVSKNVEIPWLTGREE